MSYNDGEWSQGRFYSFIKSALRKATMKWAPKFKVKSKARIARGKYLCAGYGRSQHEITTSIKRNGKRIDNVLVDHIIPVIDPSTGFTDWSSLIERMFCNSDGLQVLCYECHLKKTNEERKING